MFRDLQRRRLELEAERDEQIRRDLQVEIEEERAAAAQRAEKLRKEAADLVPDALITQFGAIGTAEMVKQRLEVYRAAGITGLQLRFYEPDYRARIAMIEQVMDMLRD